MLTPLDDDVPDQRALLRSAFALFPTGVAAVCALGPGGPIGMAASSFTSVSLDPPLVSVCFDRTSTTWPALSAAPSIGVSVLGADHAELCRDLAARDRDRFAGVQWRPTPDGSVFLCGAPLWLDCRLAETVPAGDHEIALLRVHATHADADVSPLIFHRSTLRPLPGADRGAALTGVRDDAAVATHPDNDGARLESVSWEDPRAVRLRAEMDEYLNPRYADRIRQYAATGFRRPAGMDVDPVDLVATLIAVAADGTPVGHAALRRLGDEFEVKRVYVDAGSRGTGVSVGLMLALEEIARGQGATRLILQTGDRQPEAVGLYHKLGYQRIPVYPPYGAWPHSKCFGKRL